MLIRYQGGAEQTFVLKKVVLKTVVLKTVVLKTVVLKKPIHRTSTSDDHPT
jgi:hypothetical protein